MDRQPQAHSRNHGQTARQTATATARQPQTDHTIAMDSHRHPQPEPQADSHRKTVTQPQPQPQTATTHRQQELSHAAKAADSHWHMPLAQPETIATSRCSHRQSQAQVATGMIKLQ